MERLKNCYIEMIPDEQVREKMYEHLEQDVPVYWFGRNQYAPNGENVYRCHSYAYIVQPQDNQIICKGVRILTLYDDFDRNLRDRAEFLRGLPECVAIDEIKTQVTQYWAQDVYAYLMQGLKENAIHNFADFCDIDAVQDKTLGRELRTYAFYLKGNFKSYGIAAKDTDRDYYVRTDCYDKDDNYLSALETFKENISPLDELMLEHLIVQEKQSRHENGKRRDVIMGD